MLELMAGLGLTQELISLLALNGNVVLPKAEEQLSGDSICAADTSASTRG